ncbi:thiamine pyrophosphate-dependent enzyme [Hwanghaeella sp.]|uniref:thiamine pyrophosphate-dependent enzyme n=1 Tax=Hwanghaeella sp. TaxID=2605943 RepID=UPI003CCBB33A
MGEVMSGNRMDRRAAVARLLEGRKDLLVVTGLGSPSYDAMAAGDHPMNYYLWAAMGSATTVGLGLAMSQPDKSVLVLTGDGELMMGVGALATVSVTGPKNLTIAVLDNGLFGETGQQLSHAGKGIEISKLAASMDFAWTGIVEDEAGIDDLRGRLARRDGPQLATIKVTGENAPRVLPPRDGVHIKNRFRSALGFEPI